ncbi:hypothetical protein F8O07_02385 [Pseudoclavibacter sp. CFCC 13796]|uniref:tautomerase family protein n=1 Tax=Pseudoclavibacter sp. CFCC 13796 TaxID=2615179 RepID=UPI001300CBD6|nr:hypothetical protein F8O07_02385 [Pseudoclavibacter sp. CFCC 13796]
MPLIDVSIARGRSPEQLRSLISALHTAAETAVGAAPENITIILREVDREHWARTGMTIAERDHDLTPAQTAQETTETKEDNA